MTDRLTRRHPHDHGVVAAFLCHRLCFVQRSEGVGRCGCDRSCGELLVSIALAGWLIRLVVSERREAKRTAQSLRSAEDNLRLAERKGRTDRELQQGFEQMEEALIGGLDIGALAEAVITALCRYVETRRSARCISSRPGGAEAQPVYERVAGVALHDLDEGRTYQHGEGIVGQVARTGRRHGGGVTAGGTTVSSMMGCAVGASQACSRSTPSSPIRTCSG